MSRRAIAYALIAALLVPCCALPLTPARAQDAPPPAVSADARQILVMLRLPPPHIRPNSNYGGSYGDSMSRAARRRTAQRIARREGFELIDGWPMPLVGVDCYVMRVPASISVEAAVARVSKDRAVAWSQPMQIYRTRGGGVQGGDPLAAAQPATLAWRLSDLHRVATGRGVTVAVIDSKIETSHPDLAGQFVTTQDFVVNGPLPSEQHGTGIAGVIAARADNGVGIAGVAPGARLMALRACWQTGSAAAGPTLCDTLSLAKALQYAIDHNAQVINLSLSGPPDILLAKLVDLALARKAIVVAAYDPALARGGFPALEAGVIAVGDESLQSLPALVYGAPGRDIPTTQPGGRWYLVNGSSYSAAHVSGLVALLRERRRAASPQSLAGSRPHGGTIDACASLLGPFNGCDCSCTLARELGHSARK
jgi:subtilisin family serine protease